MAIFDTVLWPDFSKRYRWRQGQHSVIIKPTGGGKTTLAGELLSLSPPGPATVAFVSKVYDRTFAKQFPVKDGWHRIEQWPPPRYKNKILLWPRFRRGTPIPAIIAHQKAVFTHALDCIFGELGWTVYFDEESYLCEMLGLQQRIAMFHTQGRSSGFTLLDGIQRPVNVPRATFSGAHHAFIANTSDADDMKRISDLGSKWTADIKKDVMTLDDYEFLYVPARVKGREPVRLTVDLNAA